MDNPDIRIQSYIQVQAIVLGLLTMAAGHSEASDYVYTDLSHFADPAGALNEQPYGLTNSGQYVTATWITFSTPALWNSNGDLMPLGHLPGVQEHPDIGPGTLAENAHGFNQLGQQVGMSYVGNDLWRGTRFDPDGAVTELASLGGNVMDWAQAINNQGRIVGQAWDGAGNNFRPVSWDPSGTHISDVRGDL